MSDTVLIRNVSPYGALETPLLRHVDVVELGETVEVSREQAAVLLAQFENWAPADAAATALAADAVSAQQQRHRDTTGEPAPAALRADWETFALRQGDDAAAGKTKKQLVAEHGTQLEDPAAVAAALAERGEQVAASSPPANEQPATGEPGSGEQDPDDVDPDAGTDSSAGDGQDGDQS